MTKMITIVGPTGSGKSDLAIQLALKYHGQIICADSRTVYKGMDIGTAKPSGGDQKKVKHYLLDVVEPNQTFSAAEFKDLANKAIEQIKKDGYLPILVGGSGMYIDSVLFDYKFRPNHSESMDLSKYSNDELIELAKQKYPNAKLETKNRRRLEQIMTRGPSNSVDRDNQKIDSLVLGIAIERLKLKQNITKRTDYFLSNGFIQEVEGIIKQYGANCVGLQSTGYSAVLEYLGGKLYKEQLRHKIIQDTLRLAKKQLTWFKRNQNIIWISDFEQADREVKRYLRV
jgi:tRNA dimethylallyltransferase